MRCSKCGAELTNDMIFCGECRTPVPKKAPVNNTGRSKRGSSKKKAVVLSAVLAGSVLVSGGAVAADVFIRDSSANSSAVLGSKYLSEEKYEQAVFCFNKTLKHNDTDAEAYLGKAKALDAMGRSKEAIEVLELASEKCSNKRLTAYLDELYDSLSAEKQDAAPQETVEAAEKTETAEPDAEAAQPKDPLLPDAQGQNAAEAEPERSYKDFVREDDYYQFYTKTHEEYEEKRELDKEGISFYAGSNGYWGMSLYKSKDGTVDNLYLCKWSSQGVSSLAYYYDKAADMVYNSGVTGGGQSTMNWVDNSDGAIDFYWNEPLYMGFPKIYINEYDASGHLMGHKGYDLEEADDKQISKAQSSTKIRTYTASNGTEVLMGYLSDNTGFFSVDEESFIFDTSKCSYRTEYEYNGHSERIAERTYDDSDLTSATERTFNSDNLLTQEETRTYSNNDLTELTRSIYEYDANGGQIRKTEYHLKKDNWTVNSEFRDGLKDIRYTAYYENGILKKFTTGEYLYEFTLSEKTYSKILVSNSDPEMETLLKGVSLDHIVLEADESGLLSSVKITDNSGAVIHENTGKWYNDPDSGQKHLLYEMYNGEQTVYVFTGRCGWDKAYEGEYEYDTNGNPISGTLYSLDQWGRKTEHSTMTAEYVRKKDVFRN